VTSIKQIAGISPVATAPGSGGQIIGAHTTSPNVAPVGIHLEATGGAVANGLWREFDEVGYNVHSDLVATGGKKALITVAFTLFPTPGDYLFDIGVSDDAGTPAKTVTGKARGASYVFTDGLYAATKSQQHTVVMTYLTGILAQGTHRIAPMCCSSTAVDNGSSVANMTMTVIEV
jgi:hypothetical protein